jgi:thioredoxin
MSLIHNIVGTPQASRVLLLVHGYGADERDLGGLLPYLDPEGRFLTVLPRGPVAAPPGFAWYDIAAVTGDPGAGGAGADAAGPDAGFLAALDALDDLLDEVCAANDKPREEAIIAGFSQGGALAVALAFGASERPHPAGVLAMSTYLPDVEGLDLDLDGDAAQQIPALVQHGTEDPMIAVERGRELAAALQEHHVPVTFRDYPMGHQVAVESVEDAHQWLLAVSAGERPREPVPTEAHQPLVRGLTTAQFEQEVLRSDLPVIVDFWAPWCQPCRQVSPIVEQIAAMREGSYKVVKVNIDEEPQLAQAFEVQSIPMIGMFRNGRLERSVLGAKPRPQIEAELGMLVIP